jgi:hypothetical protein
VSGRSLRARSVAAATLAILLSLVAVGVAVDALVARHLHRSLDHSLRRRAVEVAQLSASAPALLTRPGALDSSLAGTQVSVQVVDRHGRIVARSLDLGGRVLPTGAATRAAIRDGRSTYETDGDLRVYVAPLADIGGPAAGGAVVVAASTHDVNATLGSLHLFLSLGGLAAALLGRVLGTAL